MKHFYLFIIFKFIDNFFITDIDVESTFDKMWNEIPQNNLWNQFEQFQNQVNDILDNQMDVNFDQDYEKLFSEWEKEFQMKFNSEEEIYRRQIFKQNLQRILRHNKIQSSFKMNLNEFTILTNKEFRNKYLMKPLQIKKVRQQERQLFDDDIKEILAKLPAKISWKKQVTEVKHQGACQGCYVFSALAALEAQIKIHYNISLDLSEQELIDCGNQFKNSGCEGGQPEFVYDYIKQKGINLEENYEYKGEKQDCQNSQNQNILKILTGYSKPEENVISILQFLQYGPVVVNHYVPDDFRYYFSGIFDTTDCHHQMPINHSSIIVGYDFTHKTPYFVLKNSWGKRWGDKGYYKVKIGELSKGNPGFCFLATNGYNVFPIIDKSLKSQLKIIK